jgi:hypothetical protein
VFTLRLSFCVYTTVDLLCIHCLRFLCLHSECLFVFTLRSTCYVYTAFVFCVYTPNVFLCIKKKSTTWVVIHTIYSMIKCHLESTLIYLIFYLEHITFLSDERSANYMISYYIVIDRNMSRRLWYNVQDYSVLYNSAVLMVTCGGRHLSHMLITLAWPHHLT